MISTVQTFVVCLSVCPLSRYVVLECVYSFRIVAGVTRSSRCYS